MSASSDSLLRGVIVASGFGIMPSSIGTSRRDASLGNRKGVGFNLHSEM